MDVLLLRLRVLELESRQWRVRFPQHDAESSKLNLRTKLE
jgi:hypothetical protein